MDRVAPRAMPWHGVAGLLLIGVFWPLNWGLEGMRSHWGFFPLWLGFCLTVDALTLRRKGSSLLTRDPLGYLLLFVVSVPAWWIFEAINARTANWVYLSDGSLGPVRYAVFASLSFSTVIPAVFGAAELVGTFGWVRRLGSGPRLRPTPGLLCGLAVAGVAALAATLVWPRYFFPSVWLWGFLVLEPVNSRLGHRTLLDRTAERDWRPVVALALGALLCGFFWEMWNVHSYPKWTYRVPFVDAVRIFEMPLLGYGGYLPFALELFALHHLVAGLLPGHRFERHLQLVAD